LAKLILLGDRFFSPTELLASMGRYTGLEEGEEVEVTVDGVTKQVEFIRETANGLLLVSDGESRFTVGVGEVT